MAKNLVFTKDKALVQKLKTLHDSEMSLREIGDEVGMSFSTIRYIFKVNGIKTRKRTHSKKFVNAIKARFNLLDRDLLQKLHDDERLSAAKIAKKLNSNEDNVRRNLKYYKISTRPRHLYTTSQLKAELLKRLFIDEDMKADQIADRLGYSVRTIRKKLSIYGIKKRIGKSKPPELTPDEILEELYTVTDLAKKYKVNGATVRNWCKKRYFPNAFFKTVGKRKYWFVPKQDLEKFVRPRRAGVPIKANPSIQTILQRGNKALAKIKELYCYGKEEIFKMIALEKECFSREEIAARYRIEERLINDILEKAAIKPPRIKKERPGGRKLKRFPKDVLIELYCNTEFSVPYILDKLKTNYSSLYVNLRYYGIPLRDKNAREAAEELEQSLRQMFLKDDLTPAEIAERLGVQEAFIKRRLREFKISKSLQN